MSDVPTRAGRRHPLSVARVSSLVAALAVALIAVDDWRLGETGHSVSILPTAVVLVVLGFLLSLAIQGVLRTALWIAGGRKSARPSSLSAP